MRAPQRQFQCQWAEVGSKDFRRQVMGQFPKLRFRPEAVAGAGTEAAGPPPTLVGGGLAHRLGAQRGKAGTRLEAGHPGVAAIHHHRHTLDGQTGFGNAGGQHHLAAAGRGGPQGRVLLLGGQLPVQHMNINMCRQRSQLVGHAALVSQAGQKHQHVAGGVGGQGLAHDDGHQILQLLVRAAGSGGGALGGQVMGFHGEHPAQAADHRRAQPLAQPPGIQRGRHDE